MDDYYYTTQDEDTPITFDPTENDTDPDNPNDPDFVTITNINPPNIGTITITPNGNQVSTPSSVIVMVYCANRPPVALPDMAI